MLFLTASMVVEVVAKNPSNPLSLRIGKSIPIFTLVSLSWIYGFLVVLYNPIIPIPLYEKVLWIVVNIFTIYIFYKNKK